MNRKSNTRSPILCNLEKIKVLPFHHVPRPICFFVPVFRQICKGDHNMSSETEVLLFWKENRGGGRCFFGGKRVCISRNTVEKEKKEKGDNEMVFQMFSMLFTLT